MVNSTGKAQPSAATSPDPLAGLLGYELRRAAAALTAALAAALAPLGLRPSEASMLMTIGACPGRTQGEVGRALRIQPANMVPIINQLVLLGAAERTPGARRTLALSLTRRGRTLCRRARRVVTNHERRFSRPLAVAARRKLLATLQSICSEACRHLAS